MLSSAAVPGGARHGNGAWRTGIDSRTPITRRRSSKIRHRLDEILSGQRAGTSQLQVQDVRTLAERSFAVARLSVSSVAPVNHPAVPPGVPRRTVRSVRLPAAASTEKGQRRRIAMMRIIVFQQL